MYCEVPQWVHRDALKRDFEYKGDQMASHPRQWDYYGQAKALVWKDAEVEKKDRDLRYGLYVSIEYLGDIVKLFMFSQGLRRKRLSYQAKNSEVRRRNVPKMFPKALGSIWKTVRISGDICTTWAYCKWEWLSLEPCMPYGQIQHPSFSVTSVTGLTTAEIRAQSSHQILRATMYRDIHLRAKMT
jgi:hypothetical protein